MRGQSVEQWFLVVDQWFLGVEQWFLGVDTPPKKSMILHGPRFFQINFSFGDHTKTMAEAILAKLRRAKASSDVFQEPQDDSQQTEAYMPGYHNHDAETDVALKTPPTRRFRAKSTENFLL